MLASLRQKLFPSGEDTVVVDMSSHQTTAETPPKPKKKLKGWSMPRGLLVPNGQDVASTTAADNSTDDNHTPLEITATLVENTVNDRFASVLDNVLTPEECATWMDYPERQRGGGGEGGYEPALLNGGNKQSYRPDVRHSDRCIVDDLALAADLFQRIEKYLPQHLRRARRLGRRGQIVKTSTYEVTGLNERLRFLKYNKGGYFRPHQDGVFCRPDGSEMSWITVMLYLNGDFEGGKTCLLKPGTHAVQYTLVPKPGRVFIFEHDLPHVGEEVVEGVKLCVRTDVMYREVEEEEEREGDEARTEQGEDKTNSNSTTS